MVSLYPGDKAGDEVQQARAVNVHLVAHACPKWPNIHSRQEQATFDERACRPFQAVPKTPYGAQLHGSPQHLLGSLVSGIDSVPVDEVVQEVANVLWPPVLHINVVGMLPAPGSKAKSAQNLTHPTHRLPQTHPEYDKVRQKLMSPNENMTKYKRGVLVPFLKVQWAANGRLQRPMSTL